MKLVIDIPKKEYEILKNTPICVVFGVRIDEIIKNGTPLSEELEKIKAEIHSNMYQDSYFNKSGLERAEEIIDKHISELKGESNAKGRADIVAELEKIKAEAEELIEHCDSDYEFEEIYGIRLVVGILDNRISELKGSEKE